MFPAHPLPPLSLRSMRRDHPRRQTYTPARDIPVPLPHCERWGATWQVSRCRVGLEYPGDSFPLKRDDARRRGVIAMSAGNHAQGVAYHAKRLGIPATIVMPVGTPMVKIENTRRHGAIVIVDGATLEDSSVFARAYCKKHQLTFIHPYDDPLVIAGQGTIALEMLAAVPSVILGLWGIFIVVPWLREHLFPFLKSVFGFMPLFRGPIYGISVLAAGLIIAIMIVPIITSVSREILRSVPDLQREAAYALGATHWEVTRIAVLSYARRGLLGATMLGLGRALGETMAVTMVIGNRPEISASLFAPGYTLASVIANEFSEATTDLYISALFEIGLVLLLVTIAANALAQLLVGTFGATRSRQKPPA